MRSRRTHRCWRLTAAPSAAAHTSHSPSSGSLMRSSLPACSGPECCEMGGAGGRRTCTAATVGAAVHVGAARRGGARACSEPACSPCAGLTEVQLGGCALAREPLQAQQRRNRCSPRPLPCSSRDVPQRPATTPSSSSASRRPDSSSRAEPQGCSPPCWQCEVLRSGRRAQRAHAQLRHALSRSDAELRGRDSGALPACYRGLPGPGRAAGVRQQRPDLRGPAAAVCERHLHGRAPRCAHAVAGSPTPAPSHMPQAAGTRAPLGAAARHAPPEALPTNPRVQRRPCGSPRT